MVPEHIKLIRRYLNAEEQFRKTESEVWLERKKLLREQLELLCRKEEEREADSLQYTLFNK